MFRTYLASRTLSLTCAGVMSGDCQEKQVPLGGFLVFRVRGHGDFGPNLRKLLGKGHFRHYLFSQELAWRSEIRGRKDLGGRDGVQSGSREQDTQGLLGRHLLRSTWRLCKVAACPYGTSVQARKWHSFFWEDAVQR